MWPCRLLDGTALGSHSDSSAAEMGVAGVAGVLPPSYVDFKEAIRAEMTGVKAKMGELRKLHGQASAVGEPPQGSGCGAQGFGAGRRAAGCCCWGGQAGSRCCCRV